RRHTSSARDWSSDVCSSDLNAITRGDWWDVGGSSGLPRVSVEEEAARRLGLDLGSTVEFDIQGAKVSGRIASIRKVDWGNMSTNFYFIFEPGALQGEIKVLGHGPPVHLPAPGDPPSSHI